MQVLPGYPVEPLDSFYLYPHVSLTSGVPLSNVQLTAQIDGVIFQGWSRPYADFLLGAPRNPHRQERLKLIAYSRPTEGTTHAQISLIDCHYYLSCAGLWPSDYFGRSW
ncbi:hypothetical protein [Pseudomonas sp. A-B-26]|uniref:hypothetical protein n=1 Tax=Pseudomonas sp. A-B-26 TaxID=2832406 RepID=UPI003989C75A